MSGCMLRRRRLAQKEQNDATDAYCHKGTSGGAHGDRASRYSPDDATRLTFIVAFLWFDMKGHLESHKKQLQHLNLRVPKPSTLKADGSVAPWG